MAEVERRDLLIVGGGPAGTAAACRARELGVEPLVLDYDDLMRRIRDYSKDKLILPGFGGGDRMRFPRGGELVERLCFGPIDKDDMCARWKALYAEHGLAYEIGVEVTGLERLEDGAWRVTAWSHDRGCELGYEARHVVLALGRGVPRRFDVPGDTTGIAYRLGDAASYVGRPACVIGGGTSAAEAVIAVSNAKAAAGDPTAVYWSYRGDKMPRVSKALADAFFAAYVGNGNVHYCRHSEPLGVFRGDDRVEYLAVRVDRRRMEGRPQELALLEFPKEQVIACIGEDVPEALLNAFGIELAVGGPRRRKRMVVNRFLESRQPNVYLAGDLLSQAYFETDDFDGDPAGFREVKHRGNVKSALRDGVLVAQVIAQRLAGKKEVEVRLEEVEERAPAVAVPAAAAQRPGPPAESLAPGRSESEPIAVLVRVLPTGVEEDEHPLLAGAVTTIGRSGCDLSFAEDTLLADRHASVAHSEEGWFLRDDGGATGTFLRVRPGEKRPLGDGDLLRAGRQFLVVGRTAEGFAATHYSAAGEELGALPLSARPAVAGRDAPDLVLDPADRTLSRRHLALAATDGGVWVKDLKSVNGTYLRVRSATPLEHGDQIRAGQQLFTFSLRPEAALDEGIESPRPAGAAAAGQAAAPARAAAGAEPSDAGPTVTFRGLDRVVAVAAGETVCDAAERDGVPIRAECHSGICGSDPIRVVAGAENLTGAPDDQERETLEELCELEPGPCRLACQVRIRGPVEVEIL